MRITSIIAALAIVCSSVSFPVMAAGGHAPSVCMDGSAPAGWQRPGGFCEIAARGAETVSTKRVAPPAPPADDPAE